MKATTIHSADPGQQPQQKALWIIGHLYFLTLLIYAIIYASERSCYIDSAWQFFQRVNGERFYFPSQRFGVFLSELLLFFGLKLGLSFKLVVYTFSTSYIILYYGVWLLCVGRLKNHAAGLAIIFSTFMGVREGFLHPVTETQQCLVYSALLYAVLKYPFNNRGLHIAIGILISALSIFTHPVAVFTCGFVAALILVESKNYRSTLLWSVIGFLVVISSWRFFFPIDNYDAHLYDQLKTNASPIASNHALEFIKMHFENFYWLPELAALLTGIWLVINKEWLKLAIVVVAFSAYLIIASITFREGDSSILLERAFLPAFFMVNLVLAGKMTETKVYLKFAAPLLLLFFLINGIHYINNGCLMYKKRVAYLDELVQKGLQQGHDKYFISEDHLDRDRLLVPWAIGTETMIYSTFKYGKTISITVQDETCDPASVRVTSAECMPVALLNPKYFSLSDSAYTELIFR